MGNKPKKNKSHKGLQALVYFLLKIGAFFYVKFRFKYKIKSKYRIGKNEKVLVLSNHQSDFDPFFVQFHFNRPIHFVATDNIFATNKFLIWCLTVLLGVIPKRKGLFDMESNRAMYEAINQGKAVGTFPEGNRSYGEFQFYIPESIPKLIKYLKATLVIMNINGGTGTRPRYSSKRRKGPVSGSIKLVLKYEDYAEMPDKDLYEIIKDSLRVYDSESHQLFKGKNLAEYLEREFFVCPVCGKKETLISEGDYFKCTNCGLTVKSTEQLTLESDNPKFTFNTFNAWYQFQKKWVLNYEVPENEPIFKDDNITLLTANPYEKRIKLHTGSMALYKDKLVFGENIIIDVNKIIIASPVSGTKLSFTTDQGSFFVKGHERFNPLKYVLMFNKLDTKMKEDHTDYYYRLED